MIRGESVALRLLGLAALVVLLGACAPGAEERPGPPAAEESVSGVREVLAPDGLPIAYEVRGSGEPALVFVHCWACDRSFWREQVEAFGADHRVVTLDLGGHGESGRTRDTWRVLDLAADVEAVVDELGLDRFILVGHSMGGPVALEAARRMPGRALGIACVDTLHDLSTQFPQEMADQIAARYREDWAGNMDRVVGFMFPVERPELQAWVAQRAKLAEPEAAIQLFGDFPSLDLAAVAAEVKVPVRCVNVAASETYGQPTNLEGNSALLDFDVRLMEGVGHYLQLEAPEAFNEELRWAIASIRAAHPE